MTQSRWWVPTCINPYSPYFNKLTSIHAESFDRYLAYVGQPNNDGSID